MTPMVMLSIATVPVSFSSCRPEMYGTWLRSTLRPVAVVVSTAPDSCAGGSGRWHLVDPGRSTLSVLTLGSSRSANGCELGCLPVGVNDVALDDGTVWAILRCRSTCRATMSVASRIAGTVASGRPA